jgi:ATP-dependent phosphoenolpyruvate carboxykinase
MSIKGTRACVHAVLDGSINDVKFTKDPVFGFEVPNSLAGVESNVLNPRDVSYITIISLYLYDLEYSLHLQACYVVVS